MRGPGRRHWAPVFVPVAVAVLFAVLGHPLRAGVVAGFALLAALLILAGVPLATWVERAVGWLARGLTAVSGAVVFLVIIGPAWTWGRIVRRDPFERKRHDRGWSVHPDVASTPRSLGSPTPLSVGRRSLPSRLTWSVGCLVLLLAANYAVGWGFDRVTDPPDRPWVAIDDLTATTTSDAGGGTASTTSTFPVPPRSASKPDPRAELPAMAGYPWRYDYFADIQQTPTIYWPYTQYRPVPFTSPYVNIEGWTRRSYRTPGSADGRPTVWMLGGSTTWGEGQRDEGTIASWLARLAEADDVPIEIRNYGQRGWTHFQEMVLYEQRLAIEGAPDLALFYDGINEINTQTLVDEPVPSHYDVTQDQADQDGKVFATQFAGQRDDGSLLADLYAAYTEHSMIHKVARYLSPAAGASPTAPTGTSDDAPDDDQAQGATFYATEQDGTEAGEVYERGKQLTLALSKRYDVPTLLYWQPFQLLGPAERAAQAQLTPPTIDLSRLLLDHQDVYIDGAHTNEEGARIVAERLWRDLGPEVRSWYEANG